LASAHRHELSTGAACECIARQVHWRGHSAAAALVIASGVLGSEPAPNTVERQDLTARDLGATGYDTVYGWVLDAAIATTP
jgi:hypothetical protein